MRIGILTFHAAYNYGSMLQAWALQSVLQNLGHEVKIINYRNPKQKRMYRKPFCSFKPIYLLGDLNQLRKYGKDYINRRNRWNKFERFMYENMDLTEEYNYNTWNDTKKNFDIIITGSDQIWNLNAYDFDDVYLGSGIQDDIKLIAYAPSLGPSAEKNNVEIFKKFLQKYSHISTREDSSIRYLISNDIYKKVERVLDPTMLLDFKSYSSFIRVPYPSKEPFAYYYTPGIHSQILKKGIDISNRLSLPIKIDSGYFNVKDSDSSTCSFITDGGPAEFLSYIYHSQVVIGASFHLIVFAILMHKDFYCINGDIDERLNTLLSILDLKDRIVSLKESIALDLNQIDWEKVDTKLKEERNKSYKYLIESINE